MACVLEQHSVALVREYLSRRGYKDALAALDKDRPRAEGDLTSRNEIMRQLKLERLVKRNRERVPPLGTMLELVVEALFLGERQLKPPSRTTPDEPLSVGVAPAGEAVSLPAGGPMAKAPPAAGGGEPAKAEESSNRGGRNSRATVDAGYRPTFSELPAKPSLAPTAPSAAAAPQSSAAAGADGSRAGQPVVWTGRFGERLVVAPGEVCGQTCEFADLDSCEIFLLDWSSQASGAP